MNQITNLRDKIILGGAILIAVFALIAAVVLSFRSEINTPLILALVGIVTSVVTGLFSAYKGNPSPPDTSTTTETTTSTTQPLTDLPALAPALTSSGALDSAPPRGRETTTGGMGNG